MRLFSIKGPGTLSRTDSADSVSYSELGQRSNRVAHSLRSKISNGRRVALFMEPGPDFIAAFAGIVQAGGCAVVLSPLHTDIESAYYSADSEAALIIHSEPFRNRAEKISGGLVPLLSFVETQIEDSSEFSETDTSRAALQLYTSGTTGKPKGVVLTLENLAHQQKLLRDSWGLNERDVLLHTLPLHHMHGLCIALLSCIGAGASVRFVPQFSGSHVWEQMGSATVFMAVPTIYAKLLQAFDEAGPETQARWKENARQLRLATSGSSALPVTLARRWEELTGRIPLERFGMSEVGVALSNPLHEKRIPGSVGFPLPTVITRIEDGELWIAGPSVFKEYFKRPDATREAFVEKDGIRYFRTGDTVELGPAGEFKILGRTSVDILKSGGYKLSALEIEEALREHPAIAEAAVVGIPDPVWGDRVTACLICRPGQPTPSPETVRGFLKVNLASYKIPKEFQFFAEFPRNAMGKVLKNELKNLVLSKI